MIIEINIKDSVYDEFKAGFLKAIPKPDELAILDDDQYIKDWIKAQLYNVYKTGKITIAKETTKPIIELNIYE